MRNEAIKMRTNPKRVKISLLGVGGNNFHYQRLRFDLERHWNTVLLFLLLLLLWLLVLVLLLLLLYVFHIVMV